MLSHKKPKIMSWIKNMGGFIGYIIGAIVILPVLLIGYNYFFINKNDVSNYINSYLENTTEVKIQVPAYDKSSLPNDDIYTSKSYTTSMQTKNMGRDGSKKTRMYYRLVLDGNTNKYYQVTMFDLTNGFFGAIDNNTIYAKVNKYDMDNSEYGTKDNPIIAFSVRGANKPLTELRATDSDPGGSNINIDTSPEQYKYNAFMYLTYIVKKGAFKARFETGK